MVDYGLWLVGRRRRAARRNRVAQKPNDINDYGGDNDVCAK